MWFWINDKEVTQYLVAYQKVYTREMEEDWLNRVLKGDEKNLILAILVKPDLLHIGNVGLHNIDHINKHAELGIVIGEKDYWDKGYGARAIILMLKYAFYILNLNMVYLRVVAFNRRAIKCYEKVGFRHVGRIRQFILRGERYYDLIIMDIIKRDFIRRQANKVIE